MSRIRNHPINSELLFLQHEHKSHDLFLDPNSEKQLNVRRCDGRFFAYIEKHPIPLEVMRYIREAGFGGVIDGGYRKVDHALLTAFIERWRPETHTFHLPIGEVTVTLQDVQVLWGLPINGNVVSGEDMEFSDDFTVSQFCQNMMGFTPDVDELHGNKILIKALVRRLRLPLGDDEEDFIKRARIYLMCLLGGTIFPDSSFKSVTLLYLHNLTNLGSSAQLSWGSAVIASLYRNLCKASSRGVGATQGPMLLLQLWIWERIGALAPRIVRNNYNFQTAYGARWCSSLNYEETPAHVLRTYRSVLTDLQDYQFNWKPYKDILNRLPQWCRNGHSCWRSDTFVIFWDVVEPHLPNRVMRQFGFVQHIPSEPLLTPEKHHEIHKMTRSGRRNCNWRTKHANYINYWNNRERTIADGVASDNPYATPEYMSWFLERTLLFVADRSNQEQNSSQFPDQGTQLQIMREGMSRIHHSSMNMMNNDPINSQQYQSIDDLARQYMGMTYGDERLNFQTSFVTDEPYVSNHFTIPTQLQRPNRRAGRQRAGRQLRDEMDPPNMHDMGGPSSMNEMGGPSSMPEMGGPSSTPYGTSSNNPFSGGNMFGDMSSQNFYTPYNIEHNQYNLFNQQSDDFTVSPQLMNNFQVFPSPRIDRSGVTPVAFEWDINATPNLRNDQDVVEDRDENEKQEDTEYVEETFVERNVARDRGRRQITRPSCGTHHRR